MIEKWFIIDTCPDKIFIKKYQKKISNDLHDQRLSGVKNVNYYPKNLIARWELEAKCIENLDRCFALHVHKHGMFPQLC